MTLGSPVWAPYLLTCCFSLAILFFRDHPFGSWLRSWQEGCWRECVGGRGWKGLLHHTHTTRMALANHYTRHGCSLTAAGSMALGRAGLSTLQEDLNTRPSTRRTQPTGTPTSTNNGASRGVVPTSSHCTSPLHLRMHTREALPAADDDFSSETWAPINVVLTLTSLAVIVSTSLEINVPASSRPVLITDLRTEGELGLTVCEQRVHW